MTLVYLDFSRLFCLDPGLEDWSQFSYPISLFWVVKLLTCRVLILGFLRLSVGFLVDFWHNFHILRMFVMFARHGFHDRILAWSQGWKLNIENHETFQKSNNRNYEIMKPFKKVEQLFKKYEITRLVRLVRLVRELRSWESVGVDSKRRSRAEPRRPYPCFDLCRRRPVYGQYRRTAWLGDSEFAWPKSLLRVTSAEKSPKASPLLLPAAITSVFSQAAPSGRQKSLEALDLEHFDRCDSDPLLEADWDPEMLRCWCTNPSENHCRCWQIFIHLTQKEMVKLTCRDWSVRWCKAGLTKLMFIFDLFFVFFRGGWPLLAPSGRQSAQPPLRSWAQVQWWNMMER